MQCLTIAKAAWPDFTERNSIYHLFCKFFFTTCFICEENGEIRAFLLGFISQVNREEAYIHLVAVDPRVQRGGLAGKLYQRFFNEVKKLGVLRVRLIVNTDNPRSLEFHKKMGFAPDLRGATIRVDGVDAVKDYNGPGIHMVPFAITLV